MRSKRDKGIDQRVKRKPPSPAGGKALRRLFAYYAERNLALNVDVFAGLVIPQASVPDFALPKRMTKAKADRMLRERPRKRGVSAPAKAFGAAIARASKALEKPRGRRRSRTAAPAAGAPAAAAPAWQAIGPSRIPKGQTYGSNRVDVSGRVSVIAVDPGDVGHILVASAGGGIWESKDTGATWRPCTDSMPSLAMGALTFDPKNSTVVYAGSGEGNFYATLGTGVYRSKDGGTTWAVLAAAPFVGVGFHDLVVDPADTAILYAGTTNGFYKSTNGGSSWSLKRGGQCWDVSVHSSGGAVEVLAAFPDGLFRSTNGGNSFTSVALPGAPSAWTRLAVDRVGNAADVAYVFGAAGGAAYLWRRSGTTWTRITVPSTLNVTQAWYDWYVAATPDSSSQVYIGAIDTLRGDLSGTKWSWRNITTQGSNSIHPDQHCLAFTPGNSKTIYAGNDGGVFRSANSGGAWKPLNNGLAITEIEYMAADPMTSKWLMAGTQDNGTLRYTGTTTWDHIADGDGGDCGVNEQNPNVVYHSYYNVSLERSSNRGNSWANLSPPGAASLFYPPVEVAGLTVAIGAEQLLVTRSGGAPWTAVSLGLSGGEVASAMRAVDANTLVIGTKFGQILRVNWTGTAWSKTVLTSPAPKYISCIAVDPSNPQRLWVTSSQVPGGAGRVYRSDNGGTSWMNRTAGLPGIAINSVVVDPANFKRLWVAADVGVYQSLDLGATWASMSTGLPNAMAVDLVFHRQDRRLFCGTRNRGAWVIAIP